MNTLIPRHRVLEKLRRTSPLGLRFIDAATRAFVGDGLEVGAWPKGRPHQRVPAVPTLSGAHTFRDLPGLSEFENSDAHDSWTPVAAQRRYVVEVRDKAARFLPFRFEAAAPTRGFFTIPHGDLFGVPASPPNARPDAIPLFSAPARPVPGGFAVLRAQLFLSERPTEPAAWALAEVSVSVPRRLPVIRRGMADEEGRLAVIFPYPEPAGFDLGSPPGGLLLNKQSWTVHLRIHYPFAASPPDDSDRAGGMADLDSVLRLLDGREARLEEAGSPPKLFREATLEFGRELIVPSSSDSQSRELFITPAA